MDINNITPHIGESVRNAPVVKTAADSRAIVKTVGSAIQGEDNRSDSVGSVNSRISQKKDVETAVSEVNQFFQTERRNLSFSVNETTQDVVIEVKDAETDEVIRQIPPEFVVKLAEHLQELSSEDAFGGLLLRDKA
ncbi:flagellar protein FlaG [Methylomarinum vadi]|uniref:flagellar protein FlaG n=1 Tax=Methylomarinum vadi TaxID=438855 RepID=UPI0009FC40EC|nr:flagellar protein FlaG [Methylomarinum vadi]